jgi:hypothetical protein
VVALLVGSPLIGFAQSLNDPSSTTLACHSDHTRRLRIDLAGHQDCVGKCLSSWHPRNVGVKEHNAGTSIHLCEICPT